MAALTCAAMANDTFCTIVATERATIGGQTLVNHNRLLRCYDGAIGVKTGYTKASGRTLVSCAQRGATRFVCVTLSDPDDWNDHTRLLDWAFENYAYRAVAGDTPVYAVPVLSGTVQVCAVTPEREAYLLLRPEDTVTLTAELPRFAFAPVQQGTAGGHTDGDRAGWAKRLRGALLCRTRGARPGCEDHAVCTAWPPVDARQPVFFRLLS